MARTSPRRDRRWEGTDQIRVEIHAKASDRYKVANCVQAQPDFYGFRRLAHGKVISVTVLRIRPETSGAHEAVEGGPRHARELGDGGLGDAQLKEAPDFVLLAVEP